MSRFLPQATSAFRETWPHTRLPLFFLQGILPHYCWSMYVFLLVLSHCLFSRLCDCDWLFCFFSFHAYFIMQETLLKILLTPQLFMSLLSPIKLAEWSTAFRQQAVSPLVGCLHRTIGYTFSVLPSEDFLSVCVDGFSYTHPSVFILSSSPL